MSHRNLWAVLVVTLLATPAVKAQIVDGPVFPGQPGWQQPIAERREGEEKAGRAGGTRAHTHFVHLPIPHSTPRTTPRTTIRPSSGTGKGIGAAIVGLIAALGAGLRKAKNAVVGEPPPEVLSAEPAERVVVNTPERRAADFRIGVAAILAAVVAGVIVILAVLA